MIALRNLAFEFLRQHKNVEDSVEELVCRKSRGRIIEREMLTVFENGIAGQYGKIYSLDAATLLMWIDKYLGQKSSSANYLDAGLLSPSIRITDYLRYPCNLDEWLKEANKCYTAFLNGVNETNFHPHVYDRMMLDGKININDYLQHLTVISQDMEENIKLAKQRVLAKVFRHYREQSFTYVYFIAPKS